MELFDFEREAKITREQYLEEQKQRIKSESIKVIEYIDFTRMFLEENMEKAIKDRVDEAYFMMENIYNQHKGELSDQEIKELIKDALRPARFFHGRGYYFIVSMNGVEELYPVAPQFEGKNLLDLQDEKGNFVIRDELNIIRNHGEGFVTDYWRKPDANPDSLYPKTSYIKLFTPLNWYVGCGEYLDNIEKDMQEDVIQRVKNIRFGEGGYIFVNSFSGHAIVIDSPTYKSGDYLGDLVYSDGTNHMKIQKETASQPDGGFVEYSWPKLGKEEPAPKISYVKTYDDWQWVIGSGIHIDQIDSMIEDQKQHLYQQLRLKIFLTIFFMLLLLGLVFFVANMISGRIKHNFTLFSEDLENAVQSGKMLRNENYTLKDIASVNQSINSVIQTKFKTEELLRENEERFRTIFENVPVMIAVLDKNRVKKFWNKRGEQTFEFDLEDKFDVSQIEPLLEQSAENKENFRKFALYDGEFREVKLVLKGKKAIHNWATFKTEADEVIMVGYDITVMKENQQMLKDLNETKDKFFRIISHDLQAPFNAIIGFSDVLKNDNGSIDAAQRMEIIGMIHDSALSMHRLLINLLNWARSQSGEIVVKPSRFMLHGLVEEVKSFCKIQCTKKMITFSNLVLEDCDVLADYSMTETVIRNLVSNAIKYTSAGGEISIGCTIAEDFVTVSVSDTGMGIPEDQIGNLFELSGDKQRAGTANETGTGLGLIICHDFVSRMGGKIYVKSTVGKGTTFFFTLPHSDNL
jgi:PAS domain S-box-containing protein